ncbi:MFS transporter [Nocardia jiangxiensis]|uniref:MFS transporter n=1 Tax=Nocardia jiangxiensis TaxID=282685 RepID=A0ABW6SBQ7_9NOCA
MDLAVRGWHGAGRAGHGDGGGPAARQVLGHSVPGGVLPAHVVGAATTEYAVPRLGTRGVAAVANAGFLAVALAALPRMVGPAKIGRATSVVVSGVTVACIAGVPAGTLLGQLWSWRSAFWAVASSVQQRLCRCG